MSDFTLTKRGGVTLVQPRTERASQWCDDHLWNEWRSWGRSIPVETSNLHAIVASLLLAGLSYEYADSIPPVVR